MKKLFSVFICLIFCAKPGCSQITLEQTYPSAGYFSASTNPVQYGAKLFYLVKLEVSGEKYVSVDLQNQSIQFYNLNHSLFASMSYSNVTLLGISAVTLEKNQASLLYFSENLFDTDNQIEVMYSNTYVGSNVQNAVTHIVNQDGTLLFTALGEVPLVKPTFHNQYYPIYNTAAGTKMILSKLDASAKVYSLPGNFTSLIANNNVFSNEALSLSPNPVGKGNSVTLSYELPQGISSAELKVFDVNGKEIRSYRISDEMHEILVESGELPAGVYFYNVSSGAKMIGTKKSIVVD